MCDRVVSKDLFMLIYCPDGYTASRWCDEAVDYCLAALNFFPDWFVTRKMLENFHDALSANDDIFFLDEDFSKVTFFANQMGFLGVDLDKINLHDDNNFDEDFPDIVIHVRLLSW